MDLIQTNKQKIWWATQKREQWLKIKGVMELLLIFQIGLWSRSWVFFKFLWLYIRTFRYTCWNIYWWNVKSMICFKIVMAWGESRDETRLAVRLLLKLLIWTWSFFYYLYFCLCLQRCLIKTFRSPQSNNMKLYYYSMWKGLQINTCS